MLGMLLGKGSREIRRAQGRRKTAIYNLWNRIEIIVTKP